MSSSENESFSSAPPGAGATEARPNIDEDAGAPGGPTPRKRVSQACVPCARRKTKCDGALPTCGQCRQRDINDCIYTTSRRNKRARRSTFFGDPYAFEDRPGMGGYEQHSMIYQSTEGPPRGQDPGFYQDASHPQNFAALDTLATSASSRTPQIPIIPRILPPPGPGLSREVSTRLLKDYFSTIHPMWPILYKPMYDMTGCDYLPDILPPALLYAMYSIAACIQPQAIEEHLAEPPVPAQLFEQALFALQRSAADGPQGPIHPLNLLRPSIENCQALTILALQQHGVNETATAALLCGLASSMAIELKLHREMRGSFDPSEVQIRSRLWWNIFVLDKMIASELKRPVVLRTEEADAPWPSVSESDEFQLLSLRLVGQNRIVSVKTHTMSGFHTTIQITMIMEKVSREIYSLAGRAAILDGSDAAEATRMRLWEELQNYYRMLDASPLRLDNRPGTVAAPVTITNMVWMWCATILVHRPFASVQPKQPIKKDKHSLSPLDICFVASNHICDILEGYQDNLPKLSCDMIFPIFTTASTLSHYSKQLPREDPKTQRRIDLCLRWLQVLGKSWKNAGARQEMLVNSGDLRSQHEISRPSSTAIMNGPNMTESPHLHQLPPHPGSHTPAPFSSATPAPQSQHGEQGQDPHGQPPPDDWTFLNNFGDGGDEFYSMDANFRELLQHPFDPALAQGGPPGHVQIGQVSA